MRLERNNFYFLETIIILMQMLKVDVFSSSDSFTKKCYQSSFQSNLTLTGNE